jgi:restriction system protein
MDREELDKVKRGRRFDAIVPLTSDQGLKPGDQIEWLEAIGNDDAPELVQDGERARVTVARVRDEEHVWNGRRLFYFAWGGINAVIPPMIERVDGTLIIAALFTPGHNTTEGVLIEAVTPAWREIARLVRGDPRLLFCIEPRKLEEIIAAAYKADGYDRVTLTPRSGDHGRDVIAEKDGFGCVRILDQVKAFGEHRRVSADDVRALIGVLFADQRASKGVVTTTSDFAPKIADDPSIAPFLPTRLELVNGARLIERLEHLADK